MGGLLGIGGGLIVVPCLVLTFYLLDFHSVHLMHIAIGTSLGAMLFTTASSAWAHYRLKGIYWNVFFALAPWIILGTIFGAFIADLIPSHDLKRIFGALVFFIGWYFIFHSKMDAATGGAIKPYLLIMCPMGLCIGMISAVLGIGGGLIMVPFLIAMHSPLKNAISTSAATGFLIALVGAISFFYLGLKHKPLDGSFGYIYVPAFIFIGAASIFTAPMGAKQAHRLPSSVLRRIFGIFLIFVGIIMTVG